MLYDRVYDAIDGNRRWMDRFEWDLEDEKEEWEAVSAVEDQFDDPDDDDIRIPNCASSLVECQMIFVENSRIFRILAFRLVENRMISERNFHSFLDHRHCHHEDASRPCFSL